MTLLIAAAALLIATCAVIWVIRDYRAWTDLGVGGLPHTFRGWLRMTRLRASKIDARNPAAVAPFIGAEEDHVYLGSVIRRAGPRPRVAPHPIPQRQLTQFIGTAMLQRLQALFARMVEQHPRIVRFQQSFFEKHSEAITLCHPECGHVYALSTRGEIAHIHPSDGSMHMVMSPSDTAAAIEGGWGELHSLAGRLSLPATYMFVYAPRDDTELGVVSQLLTAAVRHMSEYRRELAPETTASTAQPDPAPGVHQESLR